MDKGDDLLSESVNMDDGIDQALRASEGDEEHGEQEKEPRHLHQITEGHDSEVDQVSECELNSRARRGAGAATSEEGLKVGRFGV